MNTKNSDKHKFMQDSEMTFQEVFDFSFQRFISIIQGLAGEFEKDNFIEILKRISSETASEDILQGKTENRLNDFTSFKEWVRNPSRLMKHVLTFDIVEDTDRVLEIKVTECLWAKTFRENGASDIGYATLCHTDFAGCQAFNENIRMTRSRTLMHGDKYCNHRWIWEE
ncbi:MAG: L-2-amino-thiazoline-4-carboxylic acid hydrolase [Candidatus Aegiribacteria sp.]|nr:L-2-amino-thiazoline-4-carboxylic acid hydrolase [Candidatus Aegiribacteria sp.]